MPPPPEHRSSDSAVKWLCFGLVALPFGQTLAWDFDRVAPLAFVSGALWPGRHALVRALTRFTSLPGALRWSASFAVVAAIVSVIASPHPAPALVMLASWVLLAAATLVAGQSVAERPERGLWLLRALALSGALGTLMHWLLWRLGGSPEEAFYHHPRVMGLHLLGGVLASTALCFASEAKSRLAWFLIGLVNWGGLLWTGSRAPLAAVLCACALWFILAPRPRRLRLAVTVASLVVGGLVLSFVLDAKLSHLGWTSFWRRTVAVSSTKELTSNRTDFWSSGWGRALEHPWLGRGPDAYRYLEPKLEGAQPHNVLLQWCLDFGVPGALALALLSLYALWRGLRRTELGTAAAGWPIIAVASCAAGQLDGFFYHQIALATTALALGVSACAGRTAGVVPVQSSRWPAVWPFPAVASAIILLAHSWLYHRVNRAPPPAATDPIVRLWSAFPSTTAGLDRWIWNWSATAPDAALALSRHAQTHSPNGDYFRVVTAGILLRQGDRAGALEEMNQALAIAPWQRRALLQEMRDKVAAGN